MVVVVVAVVMVVHGNNRSSDGRGSQHENHRGNSGTTVHNNKCQSITKA